MFSKIIMDNFLNLAKDTNQQNQKAKQTPNDINLKKSISECIIVNVLKTKDKEKQVKAASKGN